MPRGDPSRKRCAIYTRKSSEEGLEQEFNSLQAQSEACEAYIRSQRHEGWVLARTRYDDGGFSGGNMERPALQQLLADIQGGRIDTIVVYKVDRLTRSLADFARLVEIFDAQGVSFVSVTQQFNTTSSMGRQILLARTHLPSAVEPDLQRSDCAQGPALPRTASGADRCRDLDRRAGSARYQRDEPSTQGRCSRAEPAGGSPDRCPGRAVHPVARRQERPTLSLLRLHCSDHRGRNGPVARLAAAGPGNRRCRDQGLGGRTDQPGAV